MIFKKKIKIVFSMGVLCCCGRKDLNCPNNPDKSSDLDLKVNPNNDILKSEAYAFNAEKERLELENKELESKNRSVRKLTNLSEIKCNDFFIKIWIETLEISYKLCDDFGNIFKPFVEMIFDKQSKTMNTMDEEKLNLSNVSENADVNISYNANIPCARKSGVNSEMLPKEKFFYFKNGVDFNGNDENKFCSILFTIKNENNYGHLKILPTITIGQIRIPISVLLRQTDRCFEGYLSLKLRENVDIGQLKVKIQCVDNSLNSTVSLFNSEIHNCNIVKNIEEVFFIA